MARKLAKKNTKKENPTVEITKSIAEYVLALFTGIICILLPLYMKEGYYKIGTAKFNAYARIVILGLPLVLLFVLIYKVFDWKEDGFNVWLKQLPKSLMITDWCMIVFLFIAVVSYLLSGNMKQAFWGYDGWFMGLFFQITLVLIYFLVSRQGKYGRIILTVLCATAFITFGIGVLHRLLIDPIGTYASISDYYKTQFLSTLGQASWYSSFVCTTLPVGVGCYYAAKKTWLRVVTGIFTFVGFMTLVTQNSDSAYIAFGMMFLALLFFAVESAAGMQRLLEILCMFFAAPKVMYLLLKVHPNETLSLDTLSNMLVFGTLAFVMFLLSALLWVLMLFLHKKGIYPVKGMRIFRNVLYGIVVLAVLSAAVVLRLSAQEKLSGTLLTLSQKVPYLTWNDRWGNGRGFTWQATGKIIAEFSPLHKLIGVGPDCFAHYAYAHYEDLLNSMWGSNTLTNAHNEWMNMIVNYGFLGAAAYLGIFTSSLTAFMKHAKECPFLIPCSVCIASYMGHNIFCYQQVLCTPFVIIVMAFGMYELRETIKNNKTRT